MPSYDPDAELTGEYVIAFVESAGEVSPVFEQKMQSIFEEHVGELEAESWYRVGDLEAAFQEVLSSVGEQTMIQGGVESAFKHEYPEGVDDLEGALKTLNDVNNAAHRGSEQTYPTGQYLHEWQDERSFRGSITTAWPYTAELVRGVYKGMVQNMVGENPTVSEVSTTSDEAGAWLYEW